MQMDERALEARLVHRLPSARVANAIRLSSAVHFGVLRDEGAPYIRHPLRVALILSEELGVDDEDLACAALLHDVLEEENDRVDEAAVREQFGARVAGLVVCLTDELKAAGLERAERKRRYLNRISREHDDCILVKLCDRLDNLRSLPYAPETTKRQHMDADTRAYLLPLVDGRGETFVTLRKLLLDALDRLKVQ